MKTSVEVDEEKVKLAKKLSHTTTLKELIDQALDAFIAQSRRKSMADLLGTHLGFGEHGDFGAHQAQQRHEVLRRVVFGVQQHVEQGELDLAQCLHAALEILGGHHLVVERARQGLARIHVRCHVA